MELLEKICIIRKAGVNLEPLLLVQDLLFSSTTSCHQCAIVNKFVKKLNFIETEHNKYAKNIDREISTTLEFLLYCC